MPTVDSEKELEDYLYEVTQRNFDESPLEEFAPEGEIFRQVNIGGYGVMDLVIVSFEFPCDMYSYPKVTITIIELKKHKINYQALGQISKYYRAIELFMNEITGELKNPLQYDIKGILIGESVDNESDFVFLANNIEWLDLITYSIDFEYGLTLNGHSREWFLKGDHFSSLRENGLRELTPIFLKKHMDWRRYNIKLKREVISPPIGELEIK